MAQLLVRNIDEELVKKLRIRAAVHGRSAEVIASVIDSRKAAGCKTNSRGVSSFAVMVIVSASSSVRVLMRMFGVKIGANQPLLSPIERLRGAVDLLHHEGKVEKQDRDMFGGLLDLPGRRVILGGQRRLAHGHGAGAEHGQDDDPCNTDFQLAQEHGL